MIEKPLKKRILIVDDDRTFNDLLVRQLNGLGFKAYGVRSWSQTETYLARHEPDLVLLDIRLPDADGRTILSGGQIQAPIIILTAYGSIKQAVEAMRLGATEYLTKPVDMEELELTINRVLDMAELRDKFDLFSSRERERTVRKTCMRGCSPALNQVLELVGAVAPENTTVLITGESGVGKELVAREIHNQSPRAEQNFVALDCCTLQENLFESELFGHERGAFTGADRQKKGLIEGAENGTLFLDEIGEISPAIQAKMLRFLETGKFRRLGGSKDLQSNARILAATNRDLDELSKKGEFRPDLFYRLSAFVITVPPLRERREDIPELTRHFIDNHDFSRRISKKLDQNAMTRLTRYNWPGNVRELKNVIERAIIISGDAPVITQHHLGLENGRQNSSSTRLEFDNEPTLEEIKRLYVKSLIVKYEGHRSRISRALGVSERNLYRMIKKYGL